MTAPLRTSLVTVGSPGSAPPRLPSFAPGAVVRRHTDVPAPEVLRRALRSTLDLLTGADRRQAPVFVAAAPYAACTATYFAERHEDPSRRLRPSHSIQMECSRLAQGLDQDLDEADRWTGELFFLCTPEHDVRQSIRSARAAVAGGVPAALVAEIAVAAGTEDGKPALSAAALLLVAESGDLSTGDPA
ncbi:hypothetical protein GCM10010168_78520 [Actinoplanes ianthinogenes]|uniref:Uncharacterized protein n=1 Tax=Actinoplanes ianthinogenes TaxID=122358 RepID=A0ABM7LKB4_9ACTN|nr:hypothetical protein [Actinoplanes ianthinogenes]BCJ39692.1 hypothetical protein Aiant_03490 [Actinoplanes ianthinogenes]GGR48086.1 hypothetical protein GCM10010168_78520 [Actinoplanes ianthinogenes]